MSHLPPTESKQLHFNCPRCNQRLAVDRKYAGAQVQCPKCASIVSAQPEDARAAGPSQRPAGSDSASGYSEPGVPGSVVNQPSGEPPSTSGWASEAQTSAPTSASSESAGPSGLDDSAAAARSDREEIFIGEGDDPVLMTADTPSQVRVDSQIAPSEPELGADTATRKLYERIRAEVGKVYVGQDELVLGTLVALFSGGHVLIESVPGLGKTLFVRTLGRVLGCDFGRIQFTADLMPSDITGAPIYNMKTQEFNFRPGPVFTQLLLADEINRSPAKTHAALLEIMQEYRVTVDGTPHLLEPPFIVLATQNPLESEGTYNLPEAQLDRFMFKLLADYPSAQEEARILLLHSSHQKLDAQLDEELEQVTNPGEIIRVTRENAQIRVDPKLVDYINRIVRLTRKWPQFYMGASPRAGISLMQGARTLAAFYGRGFAVPDDVVQIALPALRHRVILTAEAEVEGQSVDQLLTELIRSVEVPRLHS